MRIEKKDCTFACIYNLSASAIKQRTENWIMPKNKKDMEEEKFITVLTVTYTHEIAVIRGRLESEGITCFVQDEMTVQVNPFYSNAIGGVKLQVLSSDLSRTIEILKEAGYIKGENSAPSNESSYFENYSDKQQCESEESDVFCPICGSGEVVKTQKAGWFFLITSLLFAFPTPFFKKKYHCFNCKQEFKLKRK